MRVMDPTHPLCAYRYVRRWIIILWILIPSYLITSNVLQRSKCQYDQRRHDDAYAYHKYQVISGWDYRITGEGYTPNVAINNALWGHRGVEAAHTVVRANIGTFYPDIQFHELLVDGATAPMADQQRADKMFTSRMQREIDKDMLTKASTDEAPGVHHSRMPKRRDVVSVRDFACPPAGSNQIQNPFLRSRIFSRPRLVFPPIPRGGCRRSNSFVPASAFSP